MKTTLLRIGDYIIDATLKVLVGTAAIGILNNFWEFLALWLNF